MSKRVVVLSLIVLLVAAFVPLAAQAQSATGQTWSTSVTYYTPSDTGGDLTIAYYPEGSGTPVYADPITLEPHKAGSLFIGNVTGIGSTFAGAAVLEATVPVIATAVNIAQTGPDTNYARPLYDGFDIAQASNNFFIPTVLNRIIDDRDPDAVARCRVVGAHFCADQRCNLIDVFVAGIRRPFKSWPWIHTVRAAQRPEIEHFDPDLVALMDTHLAVLDAFLADGSALADLLRRQLV